MKILFVRINDKIGDTVIETFFYRELKRLNPTAHLTVMCCGNQAILKEIPYIDKLILLPPRGLLKIAVAFAKIPLLWKQKYDLLISFTPHWRMKIFNALVRAPRKECFDFIPGAHVSEAYRRVLTHLGARKIDTSYELPIPVQARNAVDTFLTQQGLNGKSFLFFNPAGGAPSRTLSVARVREITDGISNLPLVLADLHGCYKIQKKNVFSFACNDIWQTAELVRRCTYVLTVDTSISHIAQTFDKPITVLFSLKNYPNEPAKDVSLLTAWGPCGRAVQRLWAAQSVNDISPEKIISAIFEGWSHVSTHP